MKKQEFAEHLKALRIKKGLSQKELASILSVSRQNIAQYESGKRNPKYETIVKIAAALDVDIYDLLISGDMTPREAMAILKTARIKENLVKEIQQYRAIGTVEEFRKAVRRLKENSNELGDLISRKDLLHRFKYGDADTETDKAWIGAVRRIIKEQPAAFNKEKVIEELKKRKEDEKRYYSEFGDQDSLRGMRCYERAIEIVEKGGIE